MSTEIAQTVGGFGAQAAGASDLDEILATACRDVASGLDVEHVKVLEHLTEERTLLVRAGHGWAPNVVGKTRLRTDLGSPAGYALQTGTPTVANDLENEQRFEIPDLLREHGVKSAVNVIVRAGSFVFGVLEADSNQLRSFDQRDVHYLQAYANMLALAVAQSRLADENYKLTQRLNVLLQELAHRTKNNNQMLISMLHLQQARHPKLEVREVIDDIISRIHLLSSISELMLVSDKEGKVDLGTYILAILQSILEINAERSAKVTVATEITEVMVGSRHAQAVAIVVNEFVTNSFKHAFKSETGRLEIRLERVGAKTILELADNGPGRPTHDALKSGLGLQLIDATARQLGGTITWLGPPGARLRLTIP